MPRRRPFDPRRVRKPASPASNRDPAAPLSVRQLNELVRGAVQAHIPATVHVIGELGNVSRPASGHLYFTLKDHDSELRCVMWRSSAARLRFDLESGVEFIATGGVEVYIPRGSYQLIVRKLDPRGVGALELAFRQLRSRLETEGLFDPDRKKPLPPLPSRVAIITSPTGAAIRDILKTLGRRFPGVDVLVYPVRVQGDGAAAEIAAAIQTLNQHSTDVGGIDVVIVGRGGGALEDLWAFNEEVVARAIHASRIPIISAVGHEVDVTISDLVADVRAATPTAAAELVTPTREALAERLHTALAHVARQVRHARELAAARLAATCAADVLVRPLRRLLERAQWVDEQLRAVADAAKQRHADAHECMQQIELALLRFAAGVRFSQATRRIDQRLSTLRQNVDALRSTRERTLLQYTARLARRHPESLITRQADDIHERSKRAHGVLISRLRYLRQLVPARLRAIEACDPRRVLQRGFSITRDARTQQVLRSVSAIRDKQRIITQVADGEFRATADDPRQPNLFDD